MDERYKWFVGVGICLFFFSWSSYDETARTFRSTSHEISMALTRLEMVDAMQLSKVSEGLAKTSAFKEGTKSDGPMSSTQIADNFIENTRSFQLQNALVRSIVFASIGAFLVFAGFQRVRRLKRPTQEIA